MDEDLRAGSIVRDIGKLLEVVALKQTNFKLLAFDNDDLPEEER